MRRSIRWALPLVGIFLLALAGLTPRGESAPGQSDPVKPVDLQPAVTLPVTQVILFNSGVGHFTRSGQVENDARVDLIFPEQDINDLIKSLTLRDLSANGRVSAVTYDSHDPIDRTLQSFAINLNNSPTLAGILTQARGEAVEVTLANTAIQPGSLTGKIIAVEQQQQPAKDGTVSVAILNLWCSEGVRAVKLGDVQRLRFVNPVIENEMRRALETLALSHDSQKKAVSLHFAGEGKRKVEVGYVIENPIWKTSYRLVLNEKGKPYLQGWAVVENSTDEDWSKVTMALISGRPISFKMDLYNPLYVGRPTIEPDLFASLRPPTYGGSLKKEQKLHNARQSVPPDSAIMSGAGRGVVSERKLSELAEKWGSMPEAERTHSIDQLVKELPDRYRIVVKDYFQALSVYDKEKARQYAESVRSGLRAGLDLGKSVQSVATASALGDYYQHVIDRPVDLARQKSALLPIVNKEVESARVSIYNPVVHPKHPLLGLRFKNTTGTPLSQGPVTVYEGSVYAGDTRVLDLQPDEERLIGYAIDLGTEVSAKWDGGTSRITKVRAAKGIVYTATTEREERTFTVSNRSATDRTLLIELPNRKGEGYSFVGSNKPKEEAVDVHRFELSVPAKNDLSYTIVEERPLETRLQLTNSADDTIRYFISLKEATESLKEKLRDALKIKSKWDALVQEIADSDRRIQTITTDQKRVRDNLRETPKESPLFQRYLKTLEEQEKEMDDLQAKLKKFHADEATARKGYDSYLLNLTAE